MEENPSPEEHLPDDPASVAKSNRWAIGGIIAGLLVIVLVFAIVAWRKQVEHDRNVQDFVAAMRAQDQTPIRKAVEACGLRDAQTVGVASDGRSVLFQVDPLRQERLKQVSCVLIQLDAPPRVQARLEVTSGGGGALSDSWGSFKLLWGHDPAAGLQVVLQDNRAR